MLDKHKTNEAVKFLTHIINDPKKYRGKKFASKNNNPHKLEYTEKLLKELLIIEPLIIPNFNKQSDVDSKSSKQFDDFAKKLGSAHMSITKIIFIDLERMELINRKDGKATVSENGLKILNADNKERKKLLFQNAIKKLFGKVFDQFYELSITKKNITLYEYMFFINHCIDGKNLPEYTLNITKSYKLIDNWREISLERRELIIKEIAKKLNIDNFKDSPKDESFDFKNWKIEREIEFKLLNRVILKNASDELDTKLEQVLKIDQEFVRGDRTKIKTMRKKESLDERVSKTIKAFETGDNAQKIIMKYEKKHLKSKGLNELAHKVKDVSELSDDYGYDIISFYEDGKEKKIESKYVNDLREIVVFKVSHNQLRAINQEKVIIGLIDKNKKVQYLDKETLMKQKEKGNAICNEWEFKIKFK